MIIFDVAEKQKRCDITTTNDLLLICLDSFAERGKVVGKCINKIRHDEAKYIADVTQDRFSNGEAKLTLNETARGKDVFILADVGNYNCTYKMFGQINRKSPDDHFQDIKRAISAIGGKAKRITVIMPLLYSSRQHRKIKRESLDCAIALQELVSMGVNVIVTFDAHDPNVQNAIPLCSFDNIYPTPLIRTLIQHSRTDIHKDKMIIISPDTGAVSRAIYYANMLGLEIGMFYKQRDYSTVVNGKNPVSKHIYTGSDVAGKHVVIIDDMIASGGSVIETASLLKEKGAKEVSIVTSFAFFNEGISEFNKMHDMGVIGRVYSTNLSYLSDELKSAPWFCEVDLTGQIATLIDMLNRNESISSFIDQEKEIKELIKMLKDKK